MISCTINGKVYTLKVLKSKKEKARGLKDHPALGDREGLIFVYDKPVRRNFTFSDISYPCIIYFIDAEYNIVGKQNTVPFQKELVIPKFEFKYAIEICD